VSDLQQTLAARFRAALAAAFGEAYARLDPLLRPTGNPRFGDYQANVAMSLAKLVGAKPRDVAQRLVDVLQVGDLCDKVEIAGPGFVNLHLSSAFLGSQTRAAADDPRLGVPAAGEPETVVVDYSAPNVAKEMHVGHLRSTIIGDAIARTLAFLGHRVIRQNHIGDWGTQFGMLIEHMLDEGWTTGGQHSIRDLNALYQSAKKKFDADPAFAERARRRVVLLQGGDETTHALWRELIAQSQAHFDAVYRRLGVQLTDADVRGESFYNDLLPGVVDELSRKGLLTESEGALCAFPPGFKGPEGAPVPLIVRKSDGGYLYATTDLAALRYRITSLGARRVVYVTDARQKQHFAMVFATAKLAGWLEGGVRTEHVPFGTVLGDDGKPFKTRSGDTVRLSELLDEAEERALAIVSEKDRDNALGEAARARVAHVVGIGAIKYADLSSDRVKDYVFSWARMLSFDGNTAPYLQNAYVRIRAIFRKAGLSGAPAGAAVRVDEAAERALALQLVQFPQAVAAVAESLEPHRLCTYLYELAAAFHQFYEQCPVLTAPEPALKDSRLVLCDLTARTLAQGLGLLGIEVVEQM
jgi:arginyl-tRNA synthetase